MTEATRHKDCYKELLDTTVKDYDEMGKAYEAELTTLRVELKQRSSTLLAMEAKCIQLRSQVTNLEARSFIHSTLSLEYGPANEPSKPQLAFHCLQAEVAEKEEALRVDTAEVGTL